MKVVKLTIVGVFSLVMFSSCQHENSETNEPNFSYSKTQILLDDDLTIVTTQNTSSDFSADELLIGENVEINNGYVTAKNNNNLWYVPFNKKKKPILLNIVAPISISCDCSVASVGTCDTGSSTSGGTTTIRCTGGCNQGTCDMTVTIGKASNLTSLNISNGIIISSKMVMFNDKEFRE